MDLWNTETPIVDLADTYPDETLPEVPDWIESDISPSDVAAIVQGGCASGAYMPAVTYSTAAETMHKHGDEVLEYIETTYGELPNPPADESWDGRACFFLSTAVELWASAAESELEQLPDPDEVEA